MNTEQAFLHSILANPDDDPVRLIYADWLEENGQPERAEFIRLQVELARLAPDDARRPDYQRREQALLRTHLDRWWQRLPTWAREDSLLGPADSFRRGFVYEVTATAEDFLAGAKELFRVEPVESLYLGHAGPLAADLASCPHLRAIRRLACWGEPLGDQGAGTLIGSPFLTNLIELSLPGNHLGPAGVGAIAHSPNTAKLRELVLEENPIGDAGVEALTASPYLTHLTRLFLGDTQIGAAGGRALAEWRGLPLLHTLDLTLNPIPEEAREAVRNRFRGPKLFLP